MSSVQVFNGMMDEFLTDLKETFPEEKKISVYYNSFLTLKKANPRKVLELFMERATPQAALITAKDERLFTENEDIITDVHLSKLWNDDLDKDIKESIWQYLNTLYMIGTTIHSLPSNVLSTIENVAEQCASQMSESDFQAADGKAPDMGALFAGMQNMLGGMMQQNETKKVKERPKSSRSKN